MFSRFEYFDFFFLLGNYRKTELKVRHIFSLSKASLIKTPNVVYKFRGINFRESKIFKFRGLAIATIKKVCNFYEITNLAVLSNNKMT